MYVRCEIRIVQTTRTPEKNCDLFRIRTNPSLSLFTSWDWDIWDWGPGAFCFEVSATWSKKGAFPERQSLLDRVYKKLLQHVLPINRMNFVTVTVHNFKFCSHYCIRWLTYSTPLWEGGGFMHRVPQTVQQGPPADRTIFCIPQPWRHFEPAGFGWVTKNSQTNKKALDGHKHSRSQDNSATVEAGSAGKFKYHHVSWHAFDFIDIMRRSFRETHYPVLMKGQAERKALVDVVLS